MIARPRRSAALALALSGCLLGLGGEEPPAGAARPFDPAPARRLAEQRLDGARSKEIRDLYRLAWPKEGPRPPSVGDEVVLISGYISNYIVVMRWTGNAVEVDCLSTNRS